MTVEHTAKSCDDKHNRLLRTYGVDPGMAPLIEAGTRHIQDVGVQSRYSRYRTLVRRIRLRGFGSSRVCPITSRSDAYNQIGLVSNDGNLAREFGLVGALLVVAGRGGRGSIIAARL